MENSLDQPGMGQAQGLRKDDMPDGLPVVHAEGAAARNWPTGSVSMEPRKIWDW